MQWLSTGVTVMGTCAFYKIIIFKKGKICRTAWQKGNRNVGMCFRFVFIATGRCLNRCKVRRGRGLVEDARAWTMVVWAASEDVVDRSNKTTHTHNAAGRRPKGSGEFGYFCCHWLRNNTKKLWKNQSEIKLNEIYVCVRMCKKSRVCRWEGDNQIFTRSKKDKHTHTHTK